MAEVRGAATKDSLCKRSLGFQNGKLQEIEPKEEAAVHPHDAAGSNIPDYSIPSSMQSNKTENSDIQKISIPINTDEKVTTGLQSLTVHNGNIKGLLEESSDEDESDDETGRAPIQLLAEFINAVMDEDYQLAQKLCQMILLYEPDNPEAKQFSPLIEEMLQIEQQESSEDEDSEESDEETDDETDEDTSDDDENHCTAQHNS
ncbi:glutamate-rich protein 2 isoform X2 [Eleutherodactylus coqui]|uniref:glutamate-rich protein 2 isoform X2 n=1 Tax=Eleutherodactylus coqui TaxID=57060 RepID=UPI003462E2F6